jgi:hypothetical protein
MTRLGNRLHFYFGIAGLVGALASGCGDDDGGGGGGGETGGDAGGGGKTTTGGKSGVTGGKSGGVGGSNTSAGETGEAGESSTGGKAPSTGGQGNGGEDPGPAQGGSAGVPTEPDGGEPSVPTTADVDDVISAVCDWEFRCCDAGEREYRDSPFASDAAECAERLILEMRESNATDNPYPSGPAAIGGLLGTLGYVVDLSRVEVDPAGAAECVASWADADCTEEPEPNTRCSGPAGDNPCALNNLFKPKLAIGEECTVGLAETAAANDIECVVGSTCLPAAHPDNPNDFPTCVKRWLEGQPCSEDEDCDFDLFCNSEGDCEPKAAVGETCSFEDADDPQPGEEAIRCKAGLTCNPETLKCVAPCTLGYTCAVNSTDADALCPENSGCAPIEVNESEATFRVCKALGSGASDLCNSDGDCVAGSHCEVRTCEADRVAPTPCTAQNQCGTGLHCDIGGTNQCTANLAPMTACTQSFQCGPNSAGCLNTGTNGSICRNSLLATGDECGAAAACASGKCEIATASATITTCVVGAAENAMCDSDIANGNALTCRAGFGCIAGICVKQVGAGGDCNPDGDAPNAALCANGSTCTEVWDNQGEMCTDAAVPKTNGGTGLICDGA